MIFKLTKPITLNGKDNVAELDLNLEGLTGNDVLALERAMKGETGVQNVMSHFAARAARVPFEALTELSANDFMRLTNEVGNFFAQQDSMSTAPVSVSTSEPPASTSAQATPAKTEKSEKA